MEHQKGTVIVMPPDKAAEHGDKLRLVDMKGSKYRVMETFDDTPKKVKSEPRKKTDQG